MGSSNTLRRLLVGRGIERHRRSADRVPGGYAALKRPRVVASPTQFGDSRTADLEAANAIDGDRPVPRQLLDPLWQRRGCVHRGAGQHVGASRQVPWLTQIEQDRPAILGLLKRGLQLLSRYSRFSLRG